jgi:hypothetical protein
MSNLSLQVTLRSGAVKVFPLSTVESDYAMTGSWHYAMMPHMSRINDAHFEVFTNYEGCGAWELVFYHYVEGRATTGAIDFDDAEEYGADVRFSWQILLDDKPATYEEVEQALNPNA